MNRYERQEAIAKWTRATFGPATMSLRERAMRLFEEATELAQASEVSNTELLRIVENKFNRPIGDPLQELGGVMFCALAYSEALGQNADYVEMKEIDRVMSKTPASFRTRHQAKVDAGIATAMDYSDD